MAAAYLPRLPLLPPSSAPPSPRRAKALRDYSFDSQMRAALYIMLGLSELSQVGRPVGEPDGGAGNKAPSCAMP